jgi:hypothetical protein
MVYATGKSGELTLVVLQMSVDVQIHVSMLVFLPLAALL